MIPMHDIELLEMMNGVIKKAIVELRDEHVNEILNIRDELTFDDTAWYDELTSYIADLDSINNYDPADHLDYENKKRQIKSILDKLSKMISTKIDNFYPAFRVTVSIQIV